jgi:hypothetical protein
VSRGQTQGKTVAASLDIYPSRGVTVLDPELYEFFVRHWEAEILGLAAAGYVVNKRQPVIHSQTRGATVTVRDRPTQRITGRDLALFFAATLVGGVILLVFGVTFHVGWVATAGGVILGILGLLALLVIFLSN